jgi:predicted aconitase with swiveling domain
VTRLSATTLVSGRAEGSVLVLAEPLSFWGGLDALSGRIVDRWHPQSGEVLTGRILLMRAGRGSSSGSSVLAETIRLGIGPAGIVLLTRDAIVAVGAMVAAELYGSQCPVLLAGLEDWPKIAAAERLALVAEEKSAAIDIID